MTVRSGTTLMLLLATLAACKDSAPVRREPPPVPVRTALAERLDVPHRIRAIGAVESVASVTIRPQVSGQIQTIVAGEGTTVESGDLLVTIDPRPLQAALREAEANLNRLRVMAEDAERNAALVRDALGKGAATQRELDAASARAEASRAEAAAAEAMVETATLNLSYSEIRAPIPGRLGAVRVRQGTIVRANETDLMDLVQIVPIDVAFSIPEQHLSQVKRGIQVAEHPVFAVLPGSAEPLEGTLWFVDNRVDDRTGQVRLKARFDNSEGRLWPGQFAHVQLQVGIDQGAVVVPSRAVQRSQQGTFVFVVEDESRATMKPVTIERTADGVAVITEGLVGGETVITDGQLRVVPGAIVAVRSES
ncbi:MAG: efflux RND transporter periplasmic adaptor subunit [Phycisphaeraceae bacterium]|nr:efflux RND transporter periplasmic adaptor subunit [Phycisphaeraceae bacterium]